MRDIPVKSTGDLLSSGDFNTNLRSELQGIAESADFTLDPAGGPDTDINMLAKSIALYANAGWFYTESGAVNAYVLTTIGNLKTVKALSDGIIVSFVAGNANTGASTINVDGFGVKDLELIGGIALIGGEIPAGFVIARFSSSGDRFELMYTSLISGVGQVNQITNAGFGVWSNSTLEDVGTVVTLTDVTAGVCSSADTQDLALGKLFQFASGDFNGEVYEITAITPDTSFTLNDTTLTDSGSPGTGYEATPGCVAATNEAFDGWIKDTTIDVYREHNGSNTKDGEFYALKMVPSVQGDFVYWATIRTKEYHYKKFRSRTVTFGAWVKSSTASDLKLKIDDGVSSDNSSYHTGGGDWEWLEVTRTVADAGTIFYIFIQHDNASPGTAYISQPMLVYGSSIGEGNYVPQVGEIIYLEDAINGLTSYSNATISANNTINIEAESKGKIPKGIKAIRVFMVGDASSVGFYIGFGKNGTDVYDARMYSQVSSLITALSGWVQCDSDGNFYIIRNTTWNNVTVRPLAIELR